jgi:hypothetical protein
MRPPSAFHHLAIQVRDLAAAEAFYAGVLGLPVIRRWNDGAGRERSLWLGLGEGFLALERCEGEPAPRAFFDPGPGLHLVALRIDAATRASWCERLERAGFGVTHQTDFTIYVQDPEGNRVALSHHPTPAPSRSVREQ